MSYRITEPSQAKANFAISAKVTTLGLLVWLAVALIDECVFHSSHVGKPDSQWLAHVGLLTFIPALLVMGYATLRISSIAFWKNALLSSILTALIALGIGLVWPL